MKLATSKVINLLFTLILIHGATAGAQEVTGKIMLENFKFHLNGRPVQVMPFCLNDKPTIKESTKLAVVEGIPLRLGPGTEFKFKSAEEDDGRLFLVQKNGVLRLVGIRTGWGHKDGKPAPINPLSSLSKEDLKGIWGIMIDYADKSVHQKLKEIDVLQTCLSISDGAATKAQIPPLPANLRFLNLIERSIKGFNNFESLKEQKDLLQFSLISFRAPKLDISLLAGNTQLAFLDLSGAHIQNPANLAFLTNLKYLNLSYSTGVKSIQFIGAMPHLIELEMSKTEVTDLAPISNHPSIKILRASHSTVSSLPLKGSSDLRMVELLNTKVSEKNVTAFEKLHPKCFVLFDLNRNFKRDVKETSLIKVRMGITWLRMEADTSIFQVKSAEKIAAVLKQIEIANGKPGLNCACSTGPFIEFFNKDGKKLGVIGYHHGEQVEWLAGTLGNWVLSDNSMNFLNKWLTDNGAVIPIAPKKQPTPDQVSP